MHERKLWTREELIVALNLYLKLPFGKLHSGTPEIQELASLLNRTPGSIAMRLNNFASVDPYHQQRGIGGLPGGKKQVEPVWKEFSNNKEELLFESERILAEKQKIMLETKYEAVFKEFEGLKGEDKIRAVKTRVNQNVFRQIVLANYESKCAISGIDIPDLLFASHIIPWNSNKDERLNPENGICLSALFDRAFDKGYLTITSKYNVALSPLLKIHASKEYYAKCFSKIDGRGIFQPKKYLPNKLFLEYHFDAIFKKEA